MGSLRQAIVDACPGDTITFDLSGPDPDSVVIELSTGELVIDKDLTISGPTDKTLIIDAAFSSRVFNVAPDTTVLLSNLAIVDGVADVGGGIYSLGNLTISHSSISDNAAIEGGGIDAEGGTLTILNSTISGNIVDTNGGGLLNCGDTTALLVNVTISDNRSDSSDFGAGFGGGIGQVSSSTLTLRNTIVAGNFGTLDQPDDVYVLDGSVIDPASHHNLIGVDTGLAGALLPGVNGNLIGNSDVPIDPRLDVLGFFGERWGTHGLIPGSPALDAGDNAAAVAAGLTTDQRGHDRFRKAVDALPMATVDIGAVEADPMLEDIQNLVTPEDTPLSFVFQLGDTTIPFDDIAVISSDQFLIPDANLILSGNGSSRTLTVTPLPDMVGTTTIAVFVHKTLGSEDLFNFDTFDVTVDSVNDPPTLDAIPDPPAIPEDAPTQAVSVSGIGAGGGEFQMLTVTATSSNPALIPDPTVDYTSSNAQGLLYYTPAADASGSATITVTVTDDGDGTNSVSRTFTVNVTPGPARTTAGVEWVRPVGVMATPGSLLKTGGPGWNAGALSRQAILKNGNTSLEFSSPSANQFVAIGLSKGDTAQDPSDIDVAIELFQGEVFVAERGETQGSGSFGTYMAGDHFAIVVTGGAVSYQRNGVEFYSSANVPAFPLRVDTALFTPGAMITNVMITGQLVIATARPGDYDGDGQTDLDIFRPSDGTWYNLNSGKLYGTYTATQWGAGEDVPVPGDYDGDSISDVAVYRPSTGVWWILRSSSYFTTSTVVAWGAAEDIPVPGDYDGDGVTDIAVFRPSTGQWFQLFSAQNFTTYAAMEWGTAGDVPVPGDYDGDGMADLAVFRPSTGMWWIRYSSTNFATFTVVSWGVAEDITVPGDYDGDGKADLAVFRPSTGTWFVRQSSTNFATWRVIVFGPGDYVPVMGDYDGDGMSDLGVYDSTSGNWSVFYSSVNFAFPLQTAWGPGDQFPALRRQGVF